MRMLYGAAGGEKANVAFANGRRRGLPFFPCRRRWCPTSGRVRVAAVARLGRLGVVGPRAQSTMAAAAAAASTPSAASHRGEQQRWRGITMGRGAKGAAARAAACPCSRRCDLGGRGRMAGQARQRWHTSRQTARGGEREGHMPAPRASPHGMAATCSEWPAFCRAARRCAQTCLCNLRFCSPDGQVRRRARLRRWGLSTTPSSWPSQGGRAGVPGWHLRARARAPLTSSARH